MKVLVCGSRKYSNLARIEAVLSALVISELVHGDCRSGADRLASLWASAVGVPQLRCPADWDLHGRAAGPIRNKEMLKHAPDLVVAFGQGKGTDNMVALAKKANLTVIEVDR